jgi:hypothetical protein
MAASLGDEYREIARRLDERIDRLATDLLPLGRIEGRRWWRVGSLLGEPGQSLAVELRGAKRGRWRDYASGEGGDGLDLVACVKFGGDKRQAFVWARQWLGLSDSDPDRWREAQPQRRAPQNVAVERGDVGQWVRRIWLDARPLKRNDPVDAYLRGRGIDLASLAAAPSPRALRYHPALWNSQTKRAWPAMVAAISGPSGALVGVHRTWLEPTPFGIDKALIGDRRGPRGGAKRTLGAYAGGCIRLWRGASRKRWPQMAEGETLMIGEGIEDTLSAVLNRPAWRAVCAVALSSMLVLELPPQVQTIVILGQNDKPDGGADRLLHRIIKRWVADGRRVRLAKPPAFLKDWNDLAVWGRKKNIEIAWVDWGKDDAGAGFG